MLCHVVTRNNIKYNFPVIRLFPRTILASMCFGNPTTKTVLKNITFRYKCWRAELSDPKWVLFNSADCYFFSFTILLLWYSLSINQFEKQWVLNLHNRVLKIDQISKFSLNPPTPTSFRGRDFLGTSVEIYTFFGSNNLSDLLAEPSRGWCCYENRQKQQLASWKVIHGATEG